MNELNVLKRICRHLFLAVLLCAVSAATASAQVPTVTVDAKNVTIKELLQRIEANSQYTFAYIDADLLLFPMFVRLPRLLVLFF